MMMKMKLMKMKKNDSSDRRWDDGGEEGEGCFEIHFVKFRNDLQLLYYECAGDPMMCDEELVVF